MRRHSNPSLPNPLEPYLYHDLTPRVLATPRHFAYIKIAEGCDHPCTFCVIPQYRGKFRSRRFESVITEATRLFAQGVREINLIGQDTTCYGEDFGMKDGLAHLLARLAQIETPHEKWVRFLYCYPNKVTQKLLDTIAEHAALVKYIDMPLQHASANVLKRMKRGAHGDIFLKLMERIRRTIPGVAIRTSMIAGFPGETEAGFRDPVRIRARPRSSTGWACSPTPTKTPVRVLIWTARWTRATIHNRKRRLMAMQRKISRARNRAMVGREFPVLVEGPSPDTDLVWQARLSTQAPEIDGFCYINDFGEYSAASRRDPPHAHHRSARLRFDRYVDLRHRSARVATRPTLRPRSNPCRDEMKCPICKKDVSPEPVSSLSVASAARSSISAIGPARNMSSRLPCSLQNEGRKIPCLGDASVSTWFGCGYAPKAPGTAGSLAALVIALALHYGYGHVDCFSSRRFFSHPGIWSASVVARETNMNDPQIVVVDEVIGQWITLAGAATFNWNSFSLAFVLFRLLDVWKPAPARQLESLPGGWGIVADDVMAGLYGALAIFVLDRLHLFTYGI